MASHKEEKKKDYLSRRLKSTIYKACELREEVVVVPHLLIFLDVEDHPQKAAATRGNWVEEKEHSNF